VAETFLSAGALERRLSESSSSLPPSLHPLPPPNHIVDLATSLSQSLQSALLPRLPHQTLPSSFLNPQELPDLASVRTMSSTTPTLDKITTPSLSHDNIATSSSGPDEKPRARTSSGAGTVVGGEQDETANKDSFGEGEKGEDVAEESKESEAQREHRERERRSERRSISLEPVRTQSPIHTPLPFCSSRLPSLLVRSSPCQQKEEERGRGDSTPCGRRLTTLFLCFSFFSHCRTGSRL